MTRDNLSVIMVIQTFYPAVGGAEKQCLVLSQALQERGIRVEVVIERLQGFPSREIIQGISVRRLGWGGSRIWNSISFMVATFWHLFVNRRRYNVIHVHLAASHAVSAALIGRILQKKVCIKLGGGNEIGEIALSRKTFPGRMKLRALGALKPHFVIVNEDQRRELHGYRLESVPVTRIPNGVDTTIYRPLPPAEKKRMREKLGWTGLVFLYTGRFSADKIKSSIFENFLDGWARAVQGRKEISFFLVGQGPLEKDYQDAIARFGVQDSVRLMPARDNVSALYQAADVFVLPSSTEGLSNSLLEAMASNLPVLASRVPGIVDIVKDNTHGYLFDPSSPADIARLLEKTMSSPSVLQEMGAHGGATAARYAIDTTAERYEALYRSPS